MKGWICALIIIFACAQPTSSRAYIPYVPPQPPAKRYKIVGIIKGAYVTRYIKPKRENYATYEAFKAAQRMNGEGKTDFKGGPAYFGMIAANPEKFRRGTIIRIIGDGIDHTERIKDRCVKAVKEAKRGKILFDILSDMTQQEAHAWGKRKVTVEILQPA